LRKEVAAARGEALRAGGKPLAQFDLATDKEREAEAALGRHDAGTAQQRYREALAGYRLAKTEAERAVAAARAAQGRAAEARTAAERAEAPTRVASSWTKAETAQGAAEAALEQHTFDRAQTLFGDAERFYREAERNSIAALRQQQREDAERARTAAASARQEAERADARRLAPTSFASAQQKGDEADAALNRDDLVSAAKLGFQKALSMYKQAAQEAAAQRIALQRAEAAQARDHVTSAQRDAEQAAAGQRAPVLFAWAQKKEREASAAFGRSDYALAERLFSETQADYETAAQEAKRVGAGVATAQSSAEQAHRKTVIYRERAVKAEAERLAGDLFGIAQSKEVGADELMNRRSFPLAAQAYGEAGDRYLEAARRAGERREADTVRVRMRTERRRADQAAPEYKDALAEENQGASAYERLLYKEAAERFQTAQTLYARAAAKTVARPPSSAPAPTQ
jgi:hypothetical protein